MKWRILAAAGRWRSGHGALSSGGRSAARSGPGAGAGRWPRRRAGGPGGCRRSRRTDRDAPRPRVSLDEFLEEQGRGDRAGERLAAGVGEIGDRALHVAEIGRVQRQPPERIEAARGPRASRSSASSSSGVNSAGSSGPTRHPGGAGEGGAVEQQRRLLAVGLGQRVGQDQPALGVGVGDLDRGAACACVSTSPGRKAAPPTLFSTAGIEQAQADRQIERHDAAAPAPA